VLGNEWGWQEIGSQRVYRTRNSAIAEASYETSSAIDEQKQAALRYIMEAWNEALFDGIEPEMLANAAFFAALSDLVSTYGEDAVAKMTEGLSRRIHHGEFTLHRVTQ
jgi:hypothetical protein